MTFAMFCAIIFHRLLIRSLGHYDIKKASEIKTDQSGRTAMTVDEAGSHHYVDDMVSTDTLEMGDDYMY